MEERRQARLLEERKLEQEERKLEQEKILEEMKLQQERLLEERKLQLKEKEIEWKESPGNKLKLWGDALRNAVSRMPVEPVDIVSWFQSLKKLFEQLKVPDELYAVLMRPHLSDKAKFLLSRVDLEKYTDYGQFNQSINQSIDVKFVGRRYTTRPGAPTVVSGKQDQKVHS